jgi:hypothetical protein
MEVIDFNQMHVTRRDLLNEISLLSFDELNHKPDVNTWSIAQVCHHIAIAETSFAKAIRFGLKQTDSPQIDPKPIHVLSDRTKKVKAPEIVIPSEERLDLQQIVNLLNECRSFFLHVLDQIDDPSVLAKKAVKHPLFGDLSLNQWAELAYLHEDRHIEQIKELKERLL